MIDWPWPRFAASPREFGEAMGYALGCEGVIFVSTVELVCVPFEKGFKLRYSTLQSNLHEFSMAFGVQDRLEKVHDYTMKCQNMEEETL